MKQLIKLLVCCLLPVAATAQQTLSVEEVMAIVKKFHPVAKQTAIGVQIAQADVTNARAGFDPLFMGNVQRKTFDRIDYYTYTSPQLVIPTWYGIEVSGGTEYLRGSRTDPQESAGRTSFVGINIPLAKNLVMDKRRAALQQAKIFVNQSKAEQKSIINDLLYDAAAAYWKWVTAFEVHTVLSNAVMVNEKRFEMIKKTVRIGERPAIDTVEALAQLQQFQYLQNEAWLDYLNAGIDLSVYLWQQNNQPFVLTTTIQPARQWDIPALLADPVQEEATLFAAVPNHPDIQQYQFKLAGLEVERKLKFQELLPKVDFKYNQLGKGYDFGKTITTPLFENNFKFGLSVLVPLRLSQGRGQYRQAKLKIADTRYDLQLKELTIQNKIRYYRNEALILQQQIILLQKNVGNYQALQRGEEIRFFNGESSIFLINSRESKVLEGLQKLVETKIKFIKTQVAVQWAAGLLQ